MWIVSPMWHACASFLEKRGIRCSECGGRKTHKVRERQLRYLGNVGNIFYVDPYYEITEKTKCIRCGRTMVKKVTDEPVDI